MGGVQCDLFPYWTEDQKLGIKSDGHCCKTFDASADGVAFGEGIAAIVLKPLEEALKDKDPIHAVIRGSAVNSDGQSNGMSAPNPQSQKNLIQKAIKQSGVRLDEIGYFEAHGTGTKIGDPIEIEALHQLMHAAKHSSYLGSVKPNIGHLGDTAGLAGLIKTVLTIKHRQIPQQLHLKKISPFLKELEERFHIPMKNEPWELKEEQYRRVAGISSFGVSGTNSHIIIEEVTSLQDKREREEKLLPLTLSARSPASLWNYLRQMNDFLSENTSINFSDLCYTSNVNREHYPHRICIWASNHASLRNKLSQLADWREFEEYPKRLIDQGVWTSLQVISIQPNSLPTHTFIGIDYVNGKEMDFSTCYSGMAVSSIHLPVPPLELQPYWPQSKEGESDLSLDLFYDLVWEEKTPVHKMTQGQGLTLLFCDKSDFTENLAKRLTQFGRQVIFVTSGSSFRKKKSQHWEINPSVPLDYEKILIEILEENDVPIKEILHLWTYLEPSTDPFSREEILRIKERGLYSLFHLSRAVVKRLPPKEIFMTVVSSYAKKVNNEALLVQPVRSLAYGFVRVLSQEHPWIGTSSIDYEWGKDVSDCLINEILAPREEKRPLVAIRDSKCYVEVIRQKAFHDLPSSQHIEDGDVLLIFGGSGYLGSLMVDKFSQKARGTFIILSRHAPEQHFIDEIQARGSRYIHLVTDVTQPSQIEKSMEWVKKNYDTVSTIFMLTKDLAHKFIKEISFEEFAAKISSRVDGLRDVFEYAQKLHPKKWIIFSSISSLLGGKMASECCAVNQFFDSFGPYHNDKGVMTQVLNLTLVNDHRNLNLGMTPIPAIEPSEFLSTLELFLDSKEKFAIVSRFNFKDIQYLKPVIKLQFSKDCKEVDSNPREVIKKRSYSEQEIHQKLFKIWKEVLGYDTISKNANFFQIGGTSLTALKLIKLIRERLQIETTVADLFQFPYFHEQIEKFSSMSKSIENESLRKSSDLESLIQMVKHKQISIEDALEKLPNQF